MISFSTSLNELKTHFLLNQTSLRSIINSKISIKMKNVKLLFVFLALFSMTGLSAQPSPEKKAKKFTDEMTKVLSLNEEESSAIYQIQLDRFKENQVIEKEFANDPEQKKEALKKLGNKVFNQTKNILGAERQKKWKEYKSNS